MARACSSFRLFLLVLLAIAPCLPALAQVIGPYEGEVAVASQSDADREAACRRPSPVLAGAGAAPDAAHDANAAGLLQQYRYRRGGGCGRRADPPPAPDRVRRRRRPAPAGGRRRGRGTTGASSDPVAGDRRWFRRAHRVAVGRGGGAAADCPRQPARPAPAPAGLGRPGSGRRPALDLAGEDNYAVDTATRRYGGPALIGWLRATAAAGWSTGACATESEIGRWQNRDPQAAAVLAAGRTARPMRWCGWRR